MVSICRSMRSRRLSAELVDGFGTLNFGEAFERGYIELGFDLIGGDTELASEIEEILDLLGRSGSVRGRAVLLAVGGFRRVLRRGVVQPRLGLRVLRLGVLRGLLDSVSVQFVFNAVTDERERFANFGIKLFGRESVREFDFDRGMIGLAAVLRVSRNLFGIGCVEFEHNCVSFLERKDIAPPTAHAVEGAGEWG